MRFPRRNFTALVLRFVILTFSLISTLSYAGSPNPQSLASTGRLSCHPGQLWFGMVFVGQTTTVPATLTNGASTQITVSAVSQAGSGFSTSGLNLPVTLSPGESVPFTVNFSPKANGHVDGTFGFINDASSSVLYLNVHGTGATPGVVTANPSSIDFGTAASGTMTQSVTIKSIGGPTLISQVVATGSGFGTSGLNLPLTLDWGRTATFSVTFTPPSGFTAQSSRAAKGTVTILSNGSVPSLTIPLTGTGATPGSLTATATSLSFGNVQVGSSQTLPETLTNTGGSSVTVSQATASGAYSMSGLSLPATLAAGQSASFNLTFTPTAGGSASGNLSITSDASNPTLTVPLSGTGVTPGSLTASTTSLSFGNVQVGSSQTLPETLTNSGGSSVTISQATATGAYSVSGLSLPATLAAGQSASFSVKFSPTSVGSASGSLSIASNASNPTLAVPLSGTGTTPGSLTATATSLSFGNVQVGSSQTLPETLTNSGGSSVTISQATVTGGYTVNGLNLPTTLAAGQSTSFSVKFSPTTGGPVSGNLSITSNASNPTLSVPLSGTGVTPGSLTASTTSLSFGSVQVGSSQTLPETLTNSGGSSVTISQATVTGAYSVSGLSLPATLAAGQSTSFSVKFSPTSGGSASGSLSIASNASNPTLAVPLSGTGTTPGSLTATATSLSFGNVQVGSSQTLPETLTNSGGSSLTITQANVTGSPFSVTGLGLPLTLIAGQSFTFGATFAPTSAGSASGTIAVVSNASNPNLAIPMSGSGTVAGQLTVSPATLSFGNVIVGQSKSMTATLNATGSSVTVSAATTGTSEFTLSGHSFPFSIAAGNSATITVTFTPQSSGTASDSASFASNAANTPAEALTGNGTAPPQHSVDLTWNPSASGVNGYNIYRSGTSGGPYSQINTSLDSSTSYIDNTVVAGSTYYYVTTSVDASGVESVNSNQVKAVIPTP